MMVLFFEISIGRINKYLCTKQPNMTKLSVNINKIATIRNARGGNVPDVLQAAKDCERFGAHKFNTP